MKPLEQASGFTLIELLVTIALSAFVITTSIALYQVVRKAQLANAQSLTMTQNLVVAQRSIAAAVEGTLASCAGAARHISLVRDNRFWLQPKRAVAEVHRANSALPGLKKVGSSPAQRHAGSDVLVLRPARFPATPIVSHNLDEGAFVIQNTIGLRRGELATVCNENLAVVFQVSRVSAKKVFYTHATILPGNCASPFRSDECGGGHHWGSTALLARYTPSIFYIGNGRSGLALYKQQPTVFGRGSRRRLALHTQELVAGITQLKASVNRAVGSESSANIALRLTIADTSSSGERRYEKHAFTLPLQTP